jgi:hypothetical protein
MNSSTAFICIVDSIHASAAGCCGVDAFATQIKSKYENGNEIS